MASGSGPQRAWSFAPVPRLTSTFTTTWISASNIPQRENVQRADGRLVVDVDQDYCWTWTNRSAEPLAVDVTLTETGR